MALVFREPDKDRLTRRLSALAAGDLTRTQIRQLIEGRLDLLKGLPRTTLRGIAPLVSATTAATRGELEKLVGPTDDFLPVAYLDLSRAAANAVARVVDAKRHAIGTGFMVSPRLFMTNNHVIDAAATAENMILQFGYELAIDNTPMEPTEFLLDPGAFFWTSPVDEFDATVVAVGPAHSGARPLHEFGWCALSSAKDKHAEGDFVTIIQHPGGDFKQVALRGNQVIGRGKEGNTLHYGTDTLGGSSGSPVFNDQFSVVALHHAGGPRNDQFLESDQPIPDESNEGIRISALVAALRTRHDDLPPAFRPILAEALNPPTDGPAFESRRPASRAAPLTGQALSADLDLPIRVIVGDNGIAATGRSAAVASAANTIERNQEPNRDYDSRRGYDPDFLPIAVPLPTIPRSLLKFCGAPAGAIPTPSNVEMKYHHFSLVMRVDRRMPLFTIVNIDGRRARGINRETGEVEAAETWYADPRLSSEQQLIQTLFEKQRPRIFDRGHLVRRLDPAWGSPATAKSAADDTFHFTNCCPQIARFNQHLWQSIENYALTNAKDEKKRITVLTGPVFTKSDPVYRDVAIPRTFWKIVIRIEAGKLAATGFLADQGEAIDAALGTEGPESFADLGRVAVFQQTVAEIEKRSTLKFGTLRTHDTAGANLESVQPLDALDQARW